MTWHVSPEEWLLDFTTVPHGRVRAGESLDPIDDRLRMMLAPPPPRAGLIMPSITATRGAAPTRPPAPAPAPGRPTEPSRPVLQARSGEIGQVDEGRGRTGLEVELLPTSPAPAPAPAAPKPSAADLVIPSLTRPHAEDGEEGGVDADEASALDRLNPMSGPELGIPADDADDLMSAMAAGASMRAATPEPEPASEDVLEEPEEVEETELEAEPIEESDPAGVAAEPDAPPATPEPANLTVDDEHPTLVNMERASLDRPPPQPPPVAEKPPAPAERPAPPRDKPGPPRPPEKSTIPPLPGKAAPPPPTRAAPPPPSKPTPPPPTAAAAASGPRKRGWFDEAFGEHYGNIMPLDSELSAELDAAFIRKTAELGAGQTLLDVGCGDGRHCFALANLGLMVSGLDCSLAQLVRASHRNEALEAGVTLLQGDMRGLPRDRQYDVVTCLGSTLGYFETEEQNRQCLQEMVDVLRPGGKLVLHVFNRDYLVAVLPCRSWWQGRGCLVLDVADMNYFTNRMRVHRTVVFEDGRQFEHHMYIRAFSLHELGRMLTGMGMRVLETSGSRETRGKFYGATSPEIWLVAQRRDEP